MQLCTCHQCDSAFCALQLTALIKPVLLYWCAYFSPNAILMQAGWSTVPCPATLRTLICKSSARTKQSVINVALKTSLEIRLGICIYKASLLHWPDDHIGFTPSCPPTFCSKIAPPMKGFSSHPVCFTDFLVRKSLFTKGFWLATAAEIALTIARQQKQPRWSVR